MVSFDFKTYNTIKLDNYDLSAIYNKFIQDNNLTGWYNLNQDTKDVKKLAESIRSKADIFLVIGIGGSYLGSKAIIEALNPYFSTNKPEILFVGTDLSNEYLNSLINYIKGKEVYIDVISKSGTTLEILLAFNYLLEYMKREYDNYNDRIIITTNDHTGDLYEYATKNNTILLNVPEDVGGRYSVLTTVGLLPIAVAGYDVDKLLEGAKESKQHIDDCYYYATLRNEQYQSNKYVESFNVYEPKLYYFTEWLKQLFAESQGKNNKGILPISTVNTRDLHSLGQYFQEGLPILFSTTINVAKKDSKLDIINNQAVLCVAQAHYPHTSTSIININAINEYNLGYLIFFFEMSAMLGSYLLGVNYYDQPGVNGYKDLLHKVVEK